MATKGSNLLMALNMMLESDAKEKEQDTELALGILSNQMQINYQTQENELNRQTSVLNKKLELNTATLNEITDSLDTEIENLETLTGQVFSLDPLNSSGNVGNITNDIVEGSMAQLHNLVNDTQVSIEDNRSQLKEVKKQKKIATTIQDYFKGVGTSYDKGLDPERWDAEDFSLVELNKILTDRYGVTVNDPNAFIQGAFDVNQGKLATNIIDANLILDQAKQAENQAILTEIETENVVKYNEFSQIEKDKLVIESSYGGLVYPNVRDAENSIAPAQLAFTNYNTLVSSDIPKDDHKKTERDESISNAELLFNTEVYNIGADITGVYLPVQEDGTISESDMLTDEYNKNLRAGKLILNSNMALKEGWISRQANPGAHINIIPYHNMIEELHYFLMENDSLLENGDINFQEHTTRESNILKYTGNMGAADIHNTYEQGEAAIDRLQDLNQAGLNTQFSTDITSDTYSFNASEFKGQGGEGGPPGKDGSNLPLNLQHGIKIEADIDINTAFASDPDYDFLGSYGNNLEKMKSNIDLPNAKEGYKNTYNYEATIDDSNFITEGGAYRPIEGNHIGGTFSEFTHVLWGISNEKFSYKQKYGLRGRWSEFTIDESAIKEGKPKIISDIYLSDTTYSARFFEQVRGQSYTPPRIEGENTGEIGAGKLSSLDYVPTKEEALILRENADTLMDKILNEFLENKIQREDADGNLYEVTSSSTLQNSPIFYGNDVDFFVDDEGDMKFKVDEAHNIVVNLQKMMDKYFNDMSSNRVAQDAIWRDLLQHEGYTRADLPDELKYLYDKPKGYYHWETDKQIMYEQWDSYTPTIKANYGGDFNLFYIEYVKSGKKPLTNKREYNTNEIIDIYEALDKV